MMATETEQPPVAPAARGLRIQREEAWVALPAPYEDFRLRVVTDLSWKAVVDLSSGDPARAMAAARGVILEHNGWQDAGGFPLPQPSDEQFWDLVPIKMLLAALDAIAQEVSRHPNSRSGTRPT